MLLVALWKFRHHLGVNPKFQIKQNRIFLTCPPPSLQVSFWRTHSCCWSCHHQYSGSAEDLKPVWTVHEVFFASLIQQSWSFTIVDALSSLFMAAGWWLKWWVIDCIRWFIQDGLFLLLISHSFTWFKISPPKYFSNCQISGDHFG